ncbi:hypothetical protein Hamer_G017315 [Homarus americanus]|uniref:Secreted protein n=1 Tax=Homarus americanus TaxID=6706 RepID=A0A8J5JVW6_HOMAM|nr:hypothetical protein Hamer_G017315 [Homarus americanus]
MRLMCVLVVVVLVCLATDTHAGPSYGRYLTGARNRSGGRRRQGNQRGHRTNRLNSVNKPPNRSGRMRSRPPSGLPGAHFLPDPYAFVNSDVYPAVSFK